MARCLKKYMRKGQTYTVVDYGSFSSLQRMTMTHRALLEDYDCDIVGLDIRPGPNVDMVMPEPYRVPLRSNSINIVISGQVFEHIPFFWATMLEIARLLKPDGYMSSTVPSRGHVHTSVDCWRYYPDGLRAMAAFSGLTLCEVRTDFPPRRREVDPGIEAGGGRHHYAGIDVEYRYWGDTVGVFQKPRDYPTLRMVAVRKPLLWWANRSAEAALPPRAKRRKS
jgi:SAM-dependent methyltransferase